METPTPSRLKSARKAAGLTHMELVCIYIDEYKGIKDLFVNLSQKFICDFDKPHIHVKKQHCKFKEKYYRGQNIKLIIGKNGAGKTSILEFNLLAK